MRKALEAGTWAVMAVLFFSSCGGDGPVSVSPGPGELTADLLSPNSDDWGLVFRVTTDAPKSILEIRPACTCKLHVRSANERDFRGIILGGLEPGGKLIYVRVSDASEPSAYTFTVSEVAAQSGDPRLDVAGYAIVVRR